MSTHLAQDRTQDLGLVLEARVRPHVDRGNRRTKLLAFAELTIAGSFVIKGIRILQRDEVGADEMFVVFPAEKGKGASADRWYDVAHPCTLQARLDATAVILEAYKKAKGDAALALRVEETTP